MSTIILFLLVAAASAIDLHDVYSEEELSRMDPSVLEDATLNFTQLVTKYGYPVEQHSIHTKDGYILTVHRIPNGKKCKRSPEAPRTPVLLMHGLLSSSVDYIIMGPEKGLGYVLADECFDVWLCNSRGNRYSRKHERLSVKNSKFWEFSWHEMGQYDIPAIIDYVLETTGQSGLHYVGHSQGTTQFFTFASLHPEYHKKVRSAHALSPVAFMKKLKSPAVRILTLFHKPLHQLANLIGLYEFLPTCEFLNLIGRQLCKKENPSLQAICHNVLFLIAGTDPSLLNSTMLPVIISHAPAGAAIRQFVHYAQAIGKDGFKFYDHGLFGNLLRYGSVFPPSYQMDKINIPISFFYCDNDWFSDMTDVDRLAGILPNLIGKFRVPNKLFSHLDYLWAVEVKSLVYDKLISLLKRY